MRKWGDDYGGKLPAFISLKRDSLIGQWTLLFLFTAQQTPGIAVKFVSTLHHVLVL